MHEIGTKRRDGRSVALLLFAALNFPHLPHEIRPPVCVEKDVHYFQTFNRLSLFFLLNQTGSPVFHYFKKFIDYKAGPYGVYCDYFAGRLTFPIFNIAGQVVGMIGRRLDNRGVRWKKQSQEDSIIQSNGWLYRMFAYGNEPIESLISTP